MPLGTRKAQYTVFIEAQIFKLPRYYNSSHQFSLREAQSGQVPRQLSACIRFCKNLKSSQTQCWQFRIQIAVAARVPACTRYHVLGCADHVESVSKYLCGYISVIHTAVARFRGPNLRPWSMKTALGPRALAARLDTALRNFRGETGIRVCLGSSWKKE